MAEVKTVMDKRERSLLALGVVFLFAYALPILWRQAPKALIEICSITQLVVWLLFALDFLFRLVRSESKRHFLGRNWIEVVLIAVPALRPLRLLRALSAASVVSRKLDRGNAFRTSLGLRVGFATLLLWFLAALAVTEAEQSDGNIKNVGQGLWWGLTTMTTVGYGDAYPTTLTGKLIGGALMIVGVALLSIITASFASWIIERVSTEATEKAVVNAEVELLRAEVQRLEQLLAKQVEERN